MKTACCLGLMVLDDPQENGNFHELANGDLTLQITFLSPKKGLLDFLSKGLHLIVDV
jgi:hypothetical protein